jgi:hypothetical protein
MAEAAEITPSRRLQFWVVIVALVVCALAGVFVLLWFKLPTWAPAWVVEHSPWVDPIVRADQAKDRLSWSAKSKIRKSAVERLQGRGVAIIPLMIGYLEHESLVVRDLAAETLQNFTDERVARALIARLRAGREQDEPYREMMVALVKQDPALVTDFILPFPSGNTKSAIWSLEVAARLADPRLVQPMREIVWEPELPTATPDPQVIESGGRWVVAAWALARSPEPTAIPALLPAFSDPSPLIRRRAMKGLAVQFKRKLDPRLEEVVRQGMNDPDGEVRRQAMWVLSWSTISGTEERLIELAQAATPEDLPALIAALVTGWNSQQAIDQAATFLLDADEKIRIRTLKALKSARRLPSVDKVRRPLKELTGELLKEMFTLVRSSANPKDENGAMVNLLLDLADEKTAEIHRLADDALGAFGLTEAQQERWEQIRARRSDNIPSTE